MAKLTGGRGKTGKAGKTGRTKTAAKSAAATSAAASAPRRATNLSLDPTVVAAARKVLAKRGSNVSEAVNGMLQTLVRASASPDAVELPPVVRRLHGVAADAKVDRDDYRTRLRTKYGVDA